MDPLLARYSNESVSVELVLPFEFFPADTEPERR